MIITDSVKEKFPRPTGKSLTDGLYGTRKYQMQSDIVEELESNVYSACPVNLGDLFPGTLTAQCVEQTAEQDPNSRDVWYVVCTYKSVLNQTEQSRIDQPNPLDREPRINWTSRTIMVAPTTMQQTTSFYNTFTVYLDGSPITMSLPGPTASPDDDVPFIASVTNSARDPYDPPIMVPKTEWIAGITVNLTEPPEWIETYDNSVNEDDIVLDGLTIKAGRAKLEGIRLSEKMKENGVVYRQLQLNVIYRTPRQLRKGSGSMSFPPIPPADEVVAPDPWDEEILDQGMRTPSVSPSPPGWKNLQANGHDVTKPIPLNGSGKALNPSGVPIPEYLLVWKLFRPFTRKKFGGVLPGATSVTP